MFSLFDSLWLVELLKWLVYQRINYLFGMFACSMTCINSVIYHQENFHFHILGCQVITLLDWATNYDNSGRIHFIHTKADKLINTLWDFLKYPLVKDHNRGNCPLYDTYFYCYEIFQRLKCFLCFVLIYNYFWQIITFWDCFLRILMLQMRRWIHLYIGPAWMDMSR